MAEPLALVHDYLTQRGGAERVVAGWCDGFPNAPLFTTLFDPTSTFETFTHHRVIASPLNHLAPLRTHHRWAFPLLAPTVSAWRIDADVVLASSSGWAHGVRTTGRLVVYCHAPARWLYQSDRYLRESAHGTSATVASRLLTPRLRNWDTRAALRAHRYLANSRHTATMIHAAYGITADVVYPPVRTAPLTITPAAATDVLVVSRLLPYKNVDLTLRAAALAPEVSFRVVGDGPLRAALSASAPPNVTFVGAVSDDELWSHYASSRIHVAMSHEDFGITPLEAAAVGVPTVARRSGGYLDSITDETGVLIDEDHLDADTLAAAIRRALGTSFDHATLVRQAARFSLDAHLNGIRAAISD